MGIFDFVTSVANKVSSVVSTAVSKAGELLRSPMISGALHLAAHLIPGGQLASIALRLTGMLHAFNMMPKDQNIDNLGERALQAAGTGLTPEKFSNFSEYMQELQNFKLDPDVEKDRDPLTKQMAGIGIGVLGIADKMQVSNDSTLKALLLSTLDGQYFSTAKTIEILKQGSPFVQDIIDYFGRRLDGKESGKVEDTMAKIDHDLEPESTPQETYDKLDALRAKGGTENASE
jgi:hypothetical protein